MGTLLVVLAVMTGPAEFAHAQTCVYTPIEGKIRVAADSGEMWAHVPKAGTGENDDKEYVEIELYDTDDRDKVNGVVTDNYYEEADFDGGNAGYCLPDEHSSETKWYATGTGKSTVTAELKPVFDSWRVISRVRR